MMVEKAYGASLRGSSHTSTHVPNQDYYLIDNRKMYSLAVVCDGLGSKRFSHYASRLLCKIVRNEIRKRFAHNSFSPFETIETIHRKFIKRLWPFNLSNADATCLFSVVSSSNIFLFQVGDGIAAIRDASIVFADNSEKDFANETCSFGASNRSNWHIRIIKKEERPYKILLCTDGVADDLIVEKVPEFIDEMSMELLDQDIMGIFRLFKAFKVKRINSQRLRDILIKWPNKFGTDDKTLVVIK